MTVNDDDVVCHVSGEKWMKKGKVKPVKIGVTKRKKQRNVSLSLTTLFLRFHFLAFPQRNHEPEPEIFLGKKHKRHERKKCDIPRSS